MVSEPARNPPFDDQLEELLRSYGPALRAAIARCCPRGLELDHDDIEQEARVRIWQALRGESIVHHPKSYFYRVAVNAALDAVRRAKARRGEPLEPAGGRETGTRAAERPDVTDPRADPERTTAARQMLAAIERGLDGLQENRQRAARLLLQGFSSPEIAELTGWTEPKARNLAYRGLEELRRHLRSEGIDHALE
jgi:RNA polymerase sigma factor (sigma-70 family)